MNVMEMNDMKTDITAAERERLVEAALESMKNSYAPYSHFNVGAAVLAQSGKIYTGANVENASYPAGICAERSAVSCAVSHGEKKIMAVAIVGGRDFKVSSFCAPCGICRQVLREFCEPQELLVILDDGNGMRKEMTLAQLLPESFGPDSLV